MKFRTEKDSMGSVEVPSDALFSAQTQRAIENFRISGLTLPREFIYAVALIKQVAAKVNADLGLLDTSIAEAITSAATLVRKGHHDDQFPIDVFQTGSGTSTNMNVNEVLANLATIQLGAPNSKVNANDHVNMCQSSNDVIPTAIHLSTTLAVNDVLLPALEKLANNIDDKAATLSTVTKTGRTHLMDAMPITLEQELSGWSAQIRHDIARLNSTLPRLQALPQGGTAVGTGVNAHPQFGELVATRLSELTGLKFTTCNNYFSAIGAQDTAVELSGQLKVIAVSLMKIANDLRWMNSGPLAGLGEIKLKAIQPGSSIMPGKVNAVIPEAVTMVAAQVIGNDATVTIAGQSGNFQLNVMLPVIAYNLLQSVDILANAAHHLADASINNFDVRVDNLSQTLTRNPILVTALNPIIGYNKAAEIAKTAYQEGRAILAVAEEMTDIPKQELERLLDPQRLTRGGI